MEKRFNRNLRIIVLLILNGLLFALAILVYLAQPRELLAYQWLERMSTDAYIWLQGLSQTIQGELSFSNWLRYHFSDVVWAFNVSSIFSLLWIERVSKVLLVGVSVAASISFEVLQGIGLFQGTFDWWDLLYSALIGLMGAICVVQYIGMEKKDNNEIQ